MLSCVFISSVLSLLCLVNVDGYGGYRNSIPNGYNVPHPCKAGLTWQGVGHRIQDGGANRNPFGLDFNSGGKSWTTELCQKDSDGDGLTNGQELGDPGCTWSKGDSQPVVDKLSHPGVCEPWRDPKCQAQLNWLEATCESEQFVCDSLNKPDTMNITLQFPLTDVPVQETTYMCMEFDLDTSGEFHLVATEPIIDNTNVMHHAVIFGCGSVNHTVRSSPHQCGMVASRECGQILDVWVLGSKGTCLNELLGVRIGNKGFRRVALQFHWNNPSLDTNYKDESGMILYYTSTLRSNDAGVYTIGADYLYIPPETQETKQTSVCSEACTRSFSETIYVVSAFNHMHYLGVSQILEQFRNGTKVRDITNDTVYSYDSPVKYTFDPPIEILPGDTLTTTCTYNSLNRDTITVFGDATSAEMCFVFLTYYPQENIQDTFCTSWKSLPNCEIWDAPYKGCNFYNFNYKDGSRKEAAKIVAACPAGCSDECYLSILNFLDHVCMQGDLNDYTRNLYSYTEEGRQFFAGIDACVATRINTNSSTTEAPTDTKPSTTEIPADTKSSTTEIPTDTKSSTTVQTSNADVSVPLFTMFLAVFPILYVII